MISDLLYRFRALFGRAAMERELDDELRFHIERETEKHLRAGLSRDEAERRARREFGGVDLIKEESRDARGVAWADAVLKDLRYAWRGVVAKPGFSTAVVLTLGLGVGANIAMFGIVDRLLFRAPAYLSDADRVHRVYPSMLFDGELQTGVALEYRRYEEVAGSTNAFDVAAAFATRQMPVGTGERMRMLSVTATSASLFDLFDARPVIGRFFTTAEDRAPEGEHVAVLGYNYWQSEFGGSRSALGQSLLIGDALYTIIGVAPRGFTGLSESVAPALFVPVTAYAYGIRPTYAQAFNWSWLQMAVRRKPGVSLEAANADLSAAYRRSWDEGRSRRMGSADEVRLQVEAGSVLQGRGPAAGPEAKVVAWVMGVAVIVLLIACANVVNLLLARSVHRRREIALRLALGVSRARLLQQLLTETLLLAALGGVVGLAAAQWGGGTLRALFLPDETVGAVAGDGRTLLFTAITTIALALLTGLAPALQAMRSDVSGTLKACARDSGYRRSAVRSGLLLFQAALSVLLLVGAGLFVRSLLNVRGLNLGYDVDPVVLIEANLRGTKLEDAELASLVDRMVEAAHALPGVESATPVLSVPFYSTEGRGTPYVPGRDSIAGGGFVIQTGSAEYFQTTGTRIVRGRGFTTADRTGAAPVVVVNQTMAQALWPGVDPVGRQMRIGDETMPFLTVVGVAEDMRANSFDGDPAPWYFIPIEQYRQLFGPTYGAIMVRVNGNAERFIAPLRQQLQREMPGAAYVNAVSMRSLIAQQQRAWSFGAIMFVAFSTLALVLAAIGLYSVVAYAVAARTRELGVRIALGASLTTLARQVMAQGLAFAAAGILLGGAVAWLAARWIQPLLFAQPARDPLVFVAVTTILMVVALAATLLPALRATRVDPAIALRAD